MLEKVDDLNWVGGRHIYGASDVIPVHIRNLLSLSKLEREEALDYLLGAQQDMGMVTPYTPLIIPFLFELLANPTTANKGAILMTMGWLADNPYWHSEVDYHESVHQTMTILESGFSLYVELLGDSNASTRGAAVFMLWHFPKFADQVIGYFEKALVTETDTWIRHEIIEALKRLRNQTSDSKPAK
jgi:hypothetical protein